MPEVKVEVEAVNLDATTEEQPKRGWIFDELIKVGQLEAAMAHNDEEVHNIRVMLENGDGDPAELAEELALNEDIIKLDYENRATAVVIAGENFHARGCPASAENSLHLAMKSLALTCSLAFGFEPMECMRCLDEALKKSNLK